MARILLIGLDESTSGRIGTLILQENHQFEITPANARGFQTCNADVVMASGDDLNCVKLLRIFREQRPGTPFIIVTRMPETTRWLDALENGATDYWAAPFERIQLKWLLDSALKPKVHAAAA